MRRQQVHWKEYLTPQLRGMQVAYRHRSDTHACMPSSQAGLCHSGLRMLTSKQAGNQALTALHPPRAARCVQLHLRPRAPARQGGRPGSGSLHGLYCPQGPPVPTVLPEQAAASPSAPGSPAQPSTARCGPALPSYLFRLNRAGAWWAESTILLARPRLDPSSHVDAGRDCCRHAGHVLKQTAMDHRQWQHSAWCSAASLLLDRL